MNWFLDEAQDVLERLRAEYGFEVVGIGGGVVWGFKPGDDVLYVAARFEPEFSPCDQARWDTLTGMPRAR